LDHHLEHLNEGPKSEFAFLGNEPELGVPWLYDWLGQPAKAQAVVRRALLALFDDTPAGYGGHDDPRTSPALGLLATLRLLPAVPAEGAMPPGSPLFRTAALDRAGGGVQSGAPAAAADTPFVRRLTLNGRRRARPWLRFADIACGARLAFDLTAQPTAWGNG